MKRNDPERRVIVVGAGAAGMLAAGRAAEMGARVLLLEKTDQVGKKILLSGKGRCNLTNARPREEFIARYGPNGKFLYRAFHHFFRDDLIALFGRFGLELKTERGGRIFPSSDEASSVIRCLSRYLEESGAEVRLCCPVSGLTVCEGRVRGVETEGGEIGAEAVILATGGASYPGTGSSGDGYKMAALLGHTIVPLRPALVPLVVEEIGLAKSMQGVTLTNVRLSAFACRAEEIREELIPAFDVGRSCGSRRGTSPVIESRQGEMMMTHFGLGGPIVLLLSLAVVDGLKEGPVGVSLDLKPALTVKMLENRIQRDLDGSGKKGLKKILMGLLPRKLVEPIAALASVPLDRQAHQVTAQERAVLARTIKSVRFNIRRSLPLKQAIVTAGGVSLIEVDPRSMASRLASGLFFAGEVLDLDADTGGYNLQAAFSTGYLAGEKAAALALAGL